MSALIIKTTEKVWKALHWHPCDLFHQLAEDEDSSKADRHPSSIQRNEGCAWTIEAHDLVVIPSLSFSTKELEKIEGVQHYEERALYVLFALSHPLTRLSIVTSVPLDEWVVKYHFSLLPLRDPEAYMNRLNFYSVGDASPDCCLTEKILKHPRLLRRLKNHDITSQEEQRRRVMIVYRATSHEERLSEVLNMPFYAARPDQTYYGTKQGSRSIFRRLGIPCAAGTYEAETDLNVLKRSIYRILRENPHASKGVVKLSDGFSGRGNAIMDVRQIQQRLTQISEELDASDRELDGLTSTAFVNMIFHDHDWNSFSEELKVMGGIFELFIDLPEDQRKTISEMITSPSVQVVINEDGAVSVLSTHEQILENQVYHGCEFPCRSEYRLQLMQYAKKIGEYLSSQNVKDRFGVDFLCLPTPDRDRWDIYAVEINLRHTGTTHPWMTMKLLTHGHTDPKTGLFITPSGSKYYVSSDNVSDPSLKRLLPQDLYDLMMSRRDLHWHPDRQTGTIFHMLGRMSDCGTVSMTSIANSLEDARRLFQASHDYLLTEANKNLCLSAATVCDGTYWLQVGSASLPYFIPYHY